MNRMLTNGVIRDIVPMTLLVVTLALMEIARFGGSLNVESLTIAWAFIPLSMIGYHSRWWLVIIGAFIVVIYSIFVIDNGLRLAGIVVSIGAVTAPWSFYKFHQMKYDTVDTVINRLHQIEFLILGTLVNWADMKPENHHDTFREIHLRFRELITLTRAWHELSEERKAAIAEYEKSLNTKQVKHE